MHAMQPRITLITLGVRDLARARAFYEALGFGTPLAPDGDIVFFQAGPMVFGLWTELGGYGAPGVELAHNVGSREEVDAVLQAAVDAGGELRRAAEIMDWGGYSGAFADPEGYVWEVAHNPFWPLGEDGSVTLPRD
jgi:catechol 2,3-dioxygenase-like lactoylglutathione lyase family enzyme